MARTILCHTTIIWSAYVAFCTNAGSATWSWQNPHAEITQKGDLLWAPEPYNFQPGPEIRYIDYENGDDRHSGNSPQTAWKHHPWDAAATAQAAECPGNLTYVFKRGVVYRGTLTAKASGTRKNPIQLTSDPNWGEGESAIYGSVSIQHGWQPANEESAPGVPHPHNVWYRDLDWQTTPRAIWQVDESGIIRRIPIARSPNWEFSNPDDFKAGWWEWQEATTGASPESGILMNCATDKVNLSGENFEGAVVWSEWIPVMGTPHAAHVEAHNPNEGTIHFTGFFDNINRMEPRTRYFVEDLPQFLDAPGEYYYAKDGPFRGRLYLRLHDDTNPNFTTIEIAKNLTPVDLNDNSHIHISGLTFRFTNPYDPTTRPRIDPDVHSACIRNFGSGTDIRIRNCSFEHVTQPIFLKAYGDGDLIDDVVITDNLIRHTDHGAINIEDGSYYWRKLPGLGKLGHVHILRNSLEDIGFRPERSYHGHAITVFYAETQHIAGNMLKRTAGAGIFVFGGKGSGQLYPRPFSRTLVHHNKVIDSLLNSNDWGGIETWQGGPAYVFNNISGNPGGYWHREHLKTLESGKRDHTSARFGFSYYLDGAFKNYVFNNIAWGKSNELDSPLLNSAAFQEIHGYLNTYFHNTSCRFAAGMRRQAPVAGRNQYLGNLWLDLSECVFWHARPRRATEDANAGHVGAERTAYAYETLAYANNLFQTQSQYFGTFEATGVRHPTPESFANALEQRKALQSQTGWNSAVNLVRNAEMHDFRLHSISSAIDRGVRVFVPWALYDVVGEWHFLRNHQDPSRIFDEHWNMQEYYTNRETYHEMPRFDLEVVNPDPGAFSDGPLEDWTEGALYFNGLRYARLAHENLTHDVQYFSDDKIYTWPAGRNATVDMQENSFLIEIMFRTEPGHTGGLLVGKNKSSGTSRTGGYRLFINHDGYVEMELHYKENSICSRISNIIVNDGSWHHVLVEVERNKLIADNQPICIYVNGHIANGEWHGMMPTKYIQLSNTGDFLVGGGPDEYYLKGAIDFLRVARGTLSDACTSIEELYAWQFQGPHLHDFFGNAAHGRTRDAGAFEYIEVP